MSVVKSEYACPTCRAVSGQSNQILASAGELICSKDPGHRWNDTMVFLQLGPTMEFKVTMAVAPQENRTSLTIPVPIGLKQRADQLYGAKLPATITAILWQMIEGNAMVVPATDVDRLAERLGAKFSNSSELVGLIFSKTCETEDAKQERDTAVKDLKAYEGLSPGRVVVDLGKEFSSAQGKAAEAGLPLKLWVERNLLNAIESNWF